MSGEDIKFEVTSDDEIEIDHVFQMPESRNTSIDPLLISENYIEHNQMDTQPELHELFTSWGLTDDTKTYLSNCGITEPVLMELNITDVNELFPNMFQFGQKILFRANLIRWRNCQKNPVDQNVTSSNSIAINTTNTTASNNIFKNAVSVGTPANSDLRTVLSNTIKGKMALHYYSVNKTLNEKSRTSIVHCILDYLHYHKIKPTRDMLEKTASDIATLFPTEKKEIYYTTYTTVQGNKRRTMTSGKLFYRHNNTHQRLLYDVSSSPKVTHASTSNST